MSSLSNIQSAAVSKVLSNFCSSRIALAINAGGAATVKNTGAIIYAIDGVLHTKAALAAQSIAVTHGFEGKLVAAGPAAYVQPAGTTVLYVLALNAGGDVAVVQGTYLGQTITYPADLTKIVTGNGLIPTEPDGYTAVGVIKVATANAATFTPGTTALDAADVTATYYNVAVLPITL
jgi:hypothetical protein